MTYRIHESNMPRLEKKLKQIENMAMIFTTRLKERILLLLRKMV